MFKNIWRNSYIKHEVLAFNHNDQATCIAKIGYIQAFKYTWYIDFTNLRLLDAINGNLSTIKWLYEYYKNHNDWYDLSAFAAFSGKLDIIKWLYEEELCNPFEVICNAIYSSGFLDIIKWIHEKYPDLVCINSGGENLIDLAALYGHLHVIKWLHENHSPKPTTWALTYAAENGNLMIVKWLCENYRQECKIESAIAIADLNGSHCLLSTPPKETDYFAIVDYLQSL